MDELLSKEEIQRWLADSFGHLNPDVKPFFLMGVEALYVKLGGEKFVRRRMPGEKE